MILDYSQYNKYKGEDGIVNFEYVNNTLDKLKEIKGICPFCKEKIENRIYYKQNNKITWCSAVEYETVCNVQDVDGGNIHILFRVMI